MQPSTLKIKISAARTLMVGGSFMFLGVLFGAFGAHALKAMIEPKLLETWETGVKYLLLHGLSLLAMGIIVQITELQLVWSRRLITVGVSLFSFNCILYVLSGVKTFAMIVPVGGVLMLVGWILFAVEVFRAPKHS
jgi:uncharacterized membrane protein YgdD (TMEM256/DUF423 family)